MVAQVLAEAVHGRFRALPGSDQIASQFALEGLWRWLERRKPSRILEIGGGMGCASAVLKEWCQASPRSLALVLEDDPWCQAQWLQHIGAGPQFRLTTRPSPNAKPWDFVVLDGPQVPLGLWQTGLAYRAVIFVEGARRCQRQEIADAFLRGKRSGCRANWRPPDRSKGVWIIQADPTILERLWFFSVTLREWARDLPVRRAGRPVGKKAHG